jgi:diacylglycerol kinase family enzyme
MYRLKLWIVGLLICAMLLSGAPVSAIGGDTGTYVIHTNVDGVAIYFDGSYQGMTSGYTLPVVVYVTGTPYSTVTGTKSGYVSDSNSLPSLYAGETANIYLTLTPITPPPSTGSISVSSSPSNANVYVDGTYYGRTPQTVTSLSEASHSVRVEKDGYQTWQTSAYVYAGQNTPVYASLQATPTYGSISVSSSPSGAAIYLDGSYRGTTPQVLSSVTKGSHVIELNLAGYNERSSTVSVTAGQTTYISWTLTPNAQPTTGAISVSSSPGGAAIYVDSMYEGTTPSSGPFVIPNLAAGSHTVKATLSGYQDQQTTVNVNSGQTSPVSFNLASSGGQTGTVDVSSVPSGAGVYLNNEYKGITPITVPGLAPGQYTVTLELAGYQDFSTTATVTAGGTSSVVGQLAPVTTQPSGAAPIAALGALAVISALLVLRRRRDE